MKNVLIICEDAGVCGLIKSKISETVNVCIVPDLSAAVDTRDHQYNLVFVDVTTQRNNTANDFENTSKHFKRINPLTQFVALAPKEMANDGTIFLDEIGTVTPATQIKLLQVLQDGTFKRVGGTEDIHTNARIIAATNADLPEMADPNTMSRSHAVQMSTQPMLKI